MTLEPDQHLSDARKLSRHGVWRAAGRQFKVYGIAAEGRTISEGSLASARRFVLSAGPGSGAADILGFVILHPGDEGETCAVHWWEQGSVLCHRVTRRMYTPGAEAEVDARGVIGCVWELAVITAETGIWRETMMGPAPSADAYMARLHMADRV